MNATSGRISPTPFAYYDPELSCWRTSQATLALDLTPFSVTLPRSGSMRNGELFERPTLARLTGGSGCSSLLVTPTANLGVNGGSQHPAKRKAGGHGPTLADQVEHLLPTPAACNPNDGEQPETWLARRERVKVTAKNGNGMGTPLAIAVQLLPTPRATDGTKGGPNQRGSSGDLMLPSAVMLLPTPIARDWKDGAYCPNVPINGLLGRTVWALDGVTTPPQSSDGSRPSDVQHPTPPSSGEPGDLF